MDKETIAEYKGLAAFVGKCERELASDARAIKFKTKIRNFYDSHSLAEIESPSHATHGTKIKAFTWPLEPKALKIKPRQHYRMTTDTQLAETLESTVHQQASYYFPSYLSTLDLKAEDMAIQQTVKSTAHTLELLVNVPIAAAASSSKQQQHHHHHRRRRSQRHLKTPQTPVRKSSLRARADRPPLLNWQDILINAQTAGWPSAVIERARARLTSYYRPSEMLN